MQLALLLWKWLKIEEIEISGNCQFGARIDTGFFSLARVKNRRPNGGIRGPNSAYFINVILGQICSNFMGDTFTINIDFVSK